MPDGAPTLGNAHLFPDEPDVMTFEQLVDGYIRNGQAPVVALLAAYGSPAAVPEHELERLGVRRGSLVHHLAQRAVKMKADRARALRMGRRLGMTPGALRKMAAASLLQTAAVVVQELARDVRRAVSDRAPRESRRARVAPSRGSPAAASGSSAGPDDPPAAPYDPVARAREIAREVFGDGYRGAS